MGTVYGNSYLTIAATISSDSHGGLFRKTVAPIRLTAEIDDQTLTAFVRRKFHHSSYALYCDAQIESMPDLPLMKRSWVVQERYLPARVIHFADSEVVWECNEKMWCCCQAVSSQQVGTKNLFAQTFDSNDIQSLQAIMRAWHTVVPLYTTRCLTQEGDKLPALSGIAKRVQRVLGCDYLAGLWRAYLPEDLLWTASLRGCRRPTRYRAPSWSWASVEGSIEYLSSQDTFDWLMQGKQMLEEVDIEITEVQCSTGLDPTGPVSGGFLKLCGTLVEVEVICESDEFFDIPNFRCEMNGATAVLRPDVPVGLDGVGSVLKSDLLYCLKIGVVDEGRYPQECPFLALRPVGPLEYRVFARVGVVQLRVSELSKWCADAERLEITII